MQIEIQRIISYIFCGVLFYTNIFYTYKSMTNCKVQSNFPPPLSHRPSFYLRQLCYKTARTNGPISLPYADEFLSIYLNALNIELGAIVWGRSVGGREVGSGREWG